MTPRAVLPEPPPGDREVELRARPPRYVMPPAKVEGRRSRRWDAALVENLFFGTVMLLVLAFAVVLLRQVHSTWSLLGYAIVFWAVMAYLALPRMHRTLTAIYVPSYFFGRTVTPDGLLGDPVNLALRGTESQVHAAMTAAGWTLADPVTLGSSWGIVVSSVTRRSYPAAPVSPLMLFDRVQDFAYQQEVEGNPAQRHHVRFWRCPPGWLLPGGHRVDWLAAGTYDRAVGLSLFTLQVTHKIDADIDVERDYVLGSVLHAVPDARLDVLEDFSTGYHGRNGGGDSVRTDGDLPVLGLTGVTAPSPPGSVPDGTPSTGSHTPAGELLHEVGRRPFSVVAAWGLTLVSAVLSLADLFGEREQIGDDLGLGVLTGTEATVEVGAVCLVALAMYAAILWLGWRTYQGARRARLVMIALVTISQVVQMAQFLHGSRPSTGALASASVDLLTVYALTSLSARAWTSAGGALHRGQ